MRYRSCEGLEQNYMLFQGKLDRNRNYVTFCCRDGAENVSVELCKNPEDTIKNYIARRDEIINASKSLSEANEHYEICSRCSVFQEKDWVQNDKFLVHQIVYGITPAPCQAKCIYCSQQVEKRRTYDIKQDSAQHELIFETLEYMKENDMFAPNIRWDIGSGEIAVHPYRARIYNLVANSDTSWLTNCFLFDENIARNLKVNTSSNLLFSIDSGTSETWHKIKGVDNFDHVKQNVHAYSNAAALKAQILLKYLILPGINDDFNELIAFVEFAIEINAMFVVISRDRWAKNSDAIKAAGFLQALLGRNGIKSQYSFFSSEDQREIRKVAQQVSAQVYG